MATLSSPLQTPNTASAQGELPNRKKAGARPKPQARHAPPTHFLCFPLVTDESVRQLTESLAYFRSVTTPLSEQDPDATPEPEDQTQQGTTAKSAEPDGERQKLRLLPESAHRPPGTYHLTLGTMNLSKQEDMDKAVALLQQIDYLALLKDAESGDGIVRQAKARARAKNAETKGETESVLEKRHDGGEGDGPPRRQNGEATILSNTETSESANTLSHPGSSKESASTLSHTESSKESANTSSHSESSEVSQYKLLANTYPTKGGPPSSSSSSSSSSQQPRPLKSLTRPISPPPLTTSSTSTTTSPSSAVPPLSISLHSLGVFPKPTGARVFFAHPHDPSNRLQRFGQPIRRRFRDAGLITETRPLVLHATVANLIYARGQDRRGGGGGGGKGKSSAKGKPRARDGTVDATEVLRFFNGDDNRGRSARQGDHMGAMSESIALDTSAQKSTQEPQRPEAASRATLHVQSDHERDHDHDHDHNHDHNLSSPYVWARDIPITCVRICKMGAEPSVLPGWGLEYRAVAEMVFMPDAV
ncbi:hypothetical protein CLCR_04795 [Cladophialophora carrionii]|uniref:A-kinase anchor protein 7-like phosphoesterase domain-containing protein n=1 Tax=Cladophialophora carrionii TaxID=86049 RepID=A0A1C1CJP2_9EURO|nr:hypothetical protein CLCR_04795 [Cladophialophora carrionii]